MSDQPTVTDIFRRALEIREKNAGASYDSLRSQLLGEYSGKQLPSSAYLTIPEYDNVAPEEDWTAGLPVTLRGIQNEDWNDVIDGILISLEQVENYPKNQAARMTRQKSEAIAELLLPRLRKKCSKNGCRKSL